MLKFIVKYANIIKLAGIMFLSTLLVNQCNSIKKKNAEIDRLTNNTIAWEEHSNGLKDSNRTLQLTVQELKSSNDSLINHATNLAKELDIKPKTIKEIQVVEVEVEKEVEKIITRDRDFTEELKLNPLTTITVDRNDTILNVKLDFKTVQTVIKHSKKEYKKQYNNGWSRFWHFDWRKRTYNTYEVHHTNDLIQVIDTRVVEVSSN